MKRIGLFSGRFDPPNAGHLLTIQNLMLDYLLLVVPILDYPERESCTAEEARRIFEHHFLRVLPPIALNKLVFVVDSHHFAVIKREHLAALLTRCGVGISEVEYLSGNRDVLPNVERLGVPVRYVPRVDVDKGHHLDPMMFESTRVRHALRSWGMSLEEYYDIRGLRRST